MDATLAIVVGAVVALQSLQTAQIFILRRDVRRTLYPPPPPPNFSDPSQPSPPPRNFSDPSRAWGGRIDVCVICGEPLSRLELESSRRLLGRKVCAACAVAKDRM